MVREVVVSVLCWRSENFEVMVLVDNCRLFISISFHGSEVRFGGRVCLDPWRGTWTTNWKLPANDATFTNLLFGPSCVFIFALGSPFFHRLHLHFISDQSSIEYKHHRENLSPMPLQLSRNRRCHCFRGPTRDRSRSR